MSTFFKELNNHYIEEKGKLSDKKRHLKVERMSILIYNLLIY